MGQEKTGVTAFCSLQRDLTIKRTIQLKALLFLQLLLLLLLWAGTYLLLSQSTWCPACQYLCYSTCLFYAGNEQTSCTLTPNNETFIKWLAQNGQMSGSKWFHGNQLCHKKYYLFLTHEKCQTKVHLFCIYEAKLPNWFINSAIWK